MGFSRDQLVLPGHPAQLGLVDGAPYTPAPGPVGTDYDPLPEPGDTDELSELGREERRQIAFRFTTKGVQLGLDEWQRRAGRTVASLEGRPDSKRGKRIQNCGTMLAVPVCEKCGTHLFEYTMVSADCESRICPRCARGRAQKQKRRLARAMKAKPPKSRGKSWFTHTLTTWKPPGTSVERIANDADNKVWRAWKVVQDILKRHGADAAHAELEVGRGGMVHLHALVHQPWLGKDVLAEIREATEPITGGKQYNIRRAGKHKKAIAEVCKYLTKGVARNDGKANQTHPVLAAMVDVALRGRRTIREWGKLWKMLPDMEETQSFTCPRCGGTHFDLVYMTAEQRAALQAEQAAQAA